MYSGKNGDDLSFLQVNIAIAIPAIIERKIHINNLQIGCYLNWDRYPA